MEPVIRKTQLTDHELRKAEDLRYWLSRPIEERLAEVERLREQMYPGYAYQGFQRVCKIVPLKES
jgi:hypothetical protein